MTKHVIHSLDPLRIVVLYGGDSAEREISLQSGTAVATALSDRGHRVLSVDPAETPLESVDWPRYDAAFIALHGQFGEDGCVQNILQAWGVPFTGSDATASRMAFSKSASKERFIACDVPTPAYRLIHVSDSYRQLCETAQQLGYPLVMKPDASGSSLGVTFVDGPDQLRRAAEDCFEHGPFGLLERVVDGTEWTLGLFDQERLPLIRIEPQQTFYDYNAKYQDDRTGYCLDPDVSDSARLRIEETGAAAARSVGTRGIARVDLRVDELGQPWVLEVNTVPGFTDHSLVPKAAERHGWSFAELCERAVRSCVKRKLFGPHKSHDRANEPSTLPIRQAG
ncbi:MAG: D-alanine--D-alanine ligase [Planctomycetaceae bacterium]|nr:D-alanine--D-alanine ligase [Planctomycetaceae bacterium]